MSLAVTVLTFCFSAPARAQLGLSASVETDYRFRGVSLSNERPDLSLNVSYDHDSGFYAGASAIGTEGVHGGVRMLGYLEYVGFTAPIDRNLAWDVGVSNANLSERPYRRYNSNYTELFAGFVMKDVSAHVYYSPSYIGEGFSSVYADVDGAVRPARDWRLFAHAGVLTPVAGSAGPNSHAEHYDLRAGVAAEFRGLELQLAWTATSPDVYYPAGARRRREALVVGASYFF